MRLVVPMPVDRVLQCLELIVSKRRQQLRLTGQGMPKRGGGSGDLFARIKVAVPRNLSEEEKALIEKLRGLREENPRLQILAGR